MNYTSFLPLLALALTACKRDPGVSAAPAAASSAQAVGPQEAAPAPSSTAAPAPRSRLGAAVTVAAGVRPDFGATLVVLPDGRPAVGYVGAKGVTASVLDASLGWAEARVPTSAVDAEIADFDPKAQRLSEAVTPLQVSGDELLVAVDLALASSDKRSRVRCGLASAAPIVAAEPSNASDESVTDGLGSVRRCRTVVTGAGSMTLLSSVRTGEAGLESVFAVRTPGEDGGSPVDVILATKAVPGGKGPVQERHVFDPGALVRAEDGGWLAVARWGGHVVTARRDATLTTGEPALFTWLDVVAGPPAVTARGRTWAYVVPAYGKADLFGATFPAETKLPKPGRIPAASIFSSEAVADSGAPEEVTGTALVPVGDGYLFAWVQGKGAQRRARAAVLDTRLAAKDVFDLLDRPVSAVRAVPRGEKALLVLLTAKGELLAEEVDGS